MSAKKLIFLTEAQKLENRLKRSHSERFYILMNLIKIGRQMKEARIILQDK